jgi:lipopolysaccharide biosynthesis protein
MADQEKAKKKMAKKVADLMGGRPTTKEEWHEFITAGYELEFGEVDADEIEKIVELAFKINDLNQEIHHHESELIHQRENRTAYKKALSEAVKGESVDNINIAGKNIAETNKLIEQHKADVKEIKEKRRGLIAGVDDGS